MINRILRGGALSVALLSVSFAACKGDEKKAEPAPAAVQPTPEATPTPAPAPKPVAAAHESGDYFYVEATHAEPKPDDPVKVAFPEIKVVNATFDLNNLEGGTAEIEIAMAKIDSGIPKRDGHLASADYFDTAKFATATIKVKDVKAKDGDVYAATSDVTVHGISKTWPVEFTVVERNSDSITIEAEHTFPRSDFEIGKVEGDSAAAEVLAKMRLTLPAS